MLSPTASTAYRVRHHVQEALQLLEKGSADLRRIHDRFLTTYYYTVLFFLCLTFTPSTILQASIVNCASWRGFLIPRRGGFAQTLVVVTRKQLSR